ncbi:MAG TPA: hypothetical protein VG965_06830 [Patescibacteria group bacterium]|nr:hypothetical protein [Patescibacteria group bacterium]
MTTEANQPSDSHGPRDSTGRYMMTFPQPEDMVPNNIPGRENRLTNTTAYHEVMEHRRSILSLIYFLRANYDSDQLTISELSELALSVAVLPTYLTSRRTNPVDDGLLPPATIDGARMTSGMCTALFELVESRTVETTDHISGQRLFIMASGANNYDKNYFIEEDGPDSCPTPQHIAVPIFDSFINRPPASADTSFWDKYLDNDEFDRLIEFGKLTGQLVYDQEKASLLQAGSPERQEIEGHIDNVVKSMRISLGYDDSAGTHQQESI